MSKRDKKGRFTARAEVAVDGEGNQSTQEEYNYSGNNSYGNNNGYRGGANRNNHDITIRIPLPFSEYLPFILVVLCFLIISSPWILIARPVFKKAVKFFFRALNSTLRSSGGTGDEEFDF